MKNYYITCDQTEFTSEDVKELLGQTYWANQRSLETIKVSIEHSRCYGVISNETKKLIGFARVITDYATNYYICDVIVDQDHRGAGIGKDLVNTIVNDEMLKDAKGMLLTKDAHGLYKQYGFESFGDRFMMKFD